MTSRVIKFGRYVVPHALDDVKYESAAWMWAERAAWLAYEERGRKPPIDQLECWWWRQANQRRKYWDQLLDTFLDRYFAGSGIDWRAKYGEIDGVDAEAGTAFGTYLEDAAE